jgi:hypothetical protein
MEKRDLMFPDWQVEYFDALSGGSAETLEERVDEAERVIGVRLEHLVSHPEREVEQFAIKDALRTLRDIRKGREGEQV